MMSVEIHPWPARNERRLITDFVCVDYREGQCTEQIMQCDYQELCQRDRVRRDCFLSFEASVLQFRSLRISGGYEFHHTAAWNRVEVLPAWPRWKGTISKLERVPRVVSRSALGVSCTVAKYMQVRNEVLLLACINRYKSTITSAARKLVRASMYKCSSRGNAVHGRC